jgi:chemotaxis protein methyltransferase CheR
MINISDKEFKQIVEFVKTNYGVNLSEKRVMMAGRLQNVLIQNNFKSFSEYFKYIIGDKSGEAVTTLINKLTTNHTFFMRESDHFSYLRDVVLPYLEKTVKNKDLRIWSAGCSSGEEPYTLAMVLADYFGNQKGLWDSKILATDISERVLTTATNGIYSNEQLNTLPNNWYNNFFKKIDNEQSVVCDKIKNEVLFRKFNLMNTTFPFKRNFHVIFCRNVMIYFDIKTKRELVARFYNSTEPGGYLFIGHSESLNFDDTGYKYIMPAVYRKE